MTYTPNGIYTALVTPFTSADTFDEAAFRQLIEFQIGAGSSGLLVIGGSGEFVSLTPAERQPVVMDSPHGKALYLGAHARSIEGMDAAESRVLIDRLTAFGTQERFVYSHRWAPNDLILWDNRAVLHRATPLRNSHERRRMVRTTVAGA